jgi:hypothetical protein
MPDDIVFINGENIFLRPADKNDAALLAKGKMHRK